MVPTATEGGAGNAEQEVRHWKLRVF